MYQRKLPLVIHVDPLHPICLNYTCRYCPACDLLIAHQNEIEHLLTALFEQHAPQAIGNDYLVLGTVDHDFWKQGTKTPHSVQNLVDNLHDFKQVLTFKPAYGWVENGKASGKRPGRPARQRRRPKEDLSTTHIDNPDRVKVLMDKIREHLPVSVRPTPALIKLARKQELGIQRNDNLQIRSVFYLGDEGGIMCDITPDVNSREALVCSLTHLHVVGDDSLAREMRAYQQERSRKLGSQDTPRRRGR